MKRKRIWLGVLVGALLSVLVTLAVAAQDKYTLSVPNGLAFSDFRGYENWQVVAVSQTDNLLKVMVANPTMIDAYRAGVPGNGKPFPDGSKIAKIEWKPKKSTESPFAVRIPDVLQDIFFIEKNNKKFPATKGWALTLRLTTIPPSGHVQARSYRCGHLRLHVPHEGDGQGLHLHGIRHEMNMGSVRSRWGARLEFARPTHGRQLA